MAEEKIFIINLRREFSKKPNYKRAKKAVTAVKEFISKHLKVKNVKLGNNLNMFIWEKGKRNPPPKVKVKAFVKEGIAYVELPEFNYEMPKAKEEKETTKEDTKKLEEEVKKEKERELQKEMQHEEQIKQKKEHKPDVIEMPTKGVKTKEKVVKNIQKLGRVIGDTGKK